MSTLIGLLGGIAAFVKVRYLHDKAIVDNPIFRLHYRVTSAFFFACCILITAFDLFGKPIDCITSTSFPRPDALNTYCWIHSTFVLVHNETGKTPTGSNGAWTHHGVGPAQPGFEPVYHSYYQWVPFMLFLQGILFYAPHWIWKQCEGGKIKNMTEGCRGHSFGQEESRKTHCSSVSTYLRETIGTHNRLAYSYIACEVLNFVNTIGNIFFIDRFLGGAFLRYGLNVISFTEEDPEYRTDPMIQTFPRMTKCTFEMFGSSGTITNTDALCLLSLNNVNEKIYIFLWFWLVILSVASALAVAYRVLLLLVPDARIYGFRRVTLPSQGASMAIVFRIPYGDYFLLHVLGKNLPGFLFNRLVEDLAENLGYKNPKHDSLDAGLNNDAAEIELLKMNPYSHANPQDYNKL